LPEHLAHGAGVVDRLLQFRDIPVVVVPDHKRHALFRMRRRRRSQPKRRQS
jgi:hypothetical protein